MSVKEELIPAALGVAAFGLILLAFIITTIPAVRILMSLMCVAGFVLTLVLAGKQNISLEEMTVHGEPYRRNFNEHVDQMTRRSKMLFFGVWFTTTLTFPGLLAQILLTIGSLLKS